MIFGTYWSENKKKKKADKDDGWSIGVGWDTGDRYLYSSLVLNP